MSTYDDGRIACSDGRLTIRRYYFPAGDHTIDLSNIRRVRRMRMSPVRGKWRIWGSGDLRHWWNLDTTRPRKQVALVLDLGGWVLPTITPDDPDSVERLISGG